METEGREPMAISKKKCDELDMANTLLVAAAPDLLAALNEAIKMINGKPGIDQSILMRMYAAYNKATKGE
jgi:hypothetical protein